jgi:hypothetical protein
MHASPNGHEVNAWDHLGSSVNEGACQFIWDGCIAHRKDMMINEGDVYIPYKITRMHK